MVKAPPHDLLKVLTWKGHGRPDQYGEYGHTDVKYLEELKEIDGYEKLKDAIANHPKWLGDKLASAIARLRVGYTYWKPKREDYLSTDINDPFFVKIYGKPKFWSLEDRTKLFSEIIEIYKKEGINERTHEKVNEKLSEYPQDSRFPLGSLKTHHWASWAIEKMKVRNEIDEENPRILLLKISVYAPGIRDEKEPFHKLRSLRKFYELRDKISEILTKVFTIEGYDPYKLGKEEVLILTTIDGFEKIKEKLLKADLPVKIEVFDYTFVKKNSYYKVSNVNQYIVGIGIKEEIDVDTGKAEWHEILEGGYEYVAWIALKNLNLYKASEKFLEWFEELSKNLKKKEEKRDITEGKWLCYELLISVADQYYKFLEEFENRIELKEVVKSFDLSLYLKGFNSIDEGIELYENVNKVIRELDIHIPLSVVTVIADPKYPFWRIFEIISENVGVCIVRGERMIELPDEVIDEIYRIRRKVQNQPRSSIYKLARWAKVLNLKNLELRIDVMCNKGDIRQDVANAIKGLIRNIAQISNNDEDRRKELTSEALEILASFARR